MPSTTRKVGARVVLDGEEDYKKAIESLNAGSRTLASELKRLQAEYKGNTDSVEFLTEKGDILVRQLDQQKAKTAEVREMLERASKAQAEALQRLAAAENEGEEARAKAAEELRKYNLKVEEFSTALNNAEAAEFNLQHAIEENDKALQGEDKTMVGLGDTVQNLANKFGIDLPDGATKALNGMNSFSAGTVAKMAAAAAAVAAVIKVVKELGDLTLQVAAEMDDVLTNSAITGLSTEVIQGMEYASSFLDVSVDSMTDAMTRLTQAMGEARNGSEETTEKFQKLGVTFQDESDGSLRSAEDVFYDVIDALGQMEAGTERDAAAMQLFGKKAQDFNPIINAGTDAMRKYAEEAKNVGYILSKDQVEALGAVDDAYQELQLTIDGVKRQVAADFAPAAQQALEMFSNAVKKAGEWLERSGLIENLASILQSAMSLLQTIGQTVSNLPGLGSQLDGLNTVLKITATILATIADAANIVAGILIPSNWGSGMARTALGWNIDKGEMSNLQQLRYATGDGATSVYDENLGAWVGNGYNATGNDNWRGGLTWVGEAGPELVALPGGSQILNAQDSRGLGGDTFYITIDAASVREFNDIVEIAQSARMRERMR